MALHLPKSLIAFAALGFLTLSHTAAMAEIHVVSTPTPAFVAQLVLPPLPEVELQLGSAIQPAYAVPVPPRRPVNLNGNPTTSRTTRKTIATLPHGVKPARVALDIKPPRVAQHIVINKLEPRPRYAQANLATAPTTCPGFCGRYVFFGGY